MTGSMTGSMTHSMTGADVAALPASRVYVARAFLPCVLSARCSCAVGSPWRRPSGSCPYTRPVKRFNERAASAMGHGQKEKQQQRSPRTRVQSEGEGSGRAGERARVRADREP